MTRSFIILCCAILFIGCKKEIPTSEISTQEILIKQDSCFCFLPNSFSPDGNAMNDALRPISANLKTNNYSFTIRNMRQKVLFTSSTIGEAWNGDNQDAGLYIATVKGTFECGTSFEEHNCVNLINNCISRKLDVNKLVFESMFDGITQSVIYPSGETACP